MGFYRRSMGRRERRECFRWKASCWRRGVKRRDNSSHIDYIKVQTSNKGRGAIDKATILKAGGEYKLRYSVRDQNWESNRSVACDSFLSLRLKMNQIYP